MIPCSISRNDSAGGSAAALTSTMPAISGWFSASHSVRVPPIDRPATTTLSQRVARSRYAASAVDDQSLQSVSSMSSMCVPWPGSRGSSTANPAAAKASARPRIDWGHPVKPCTTRAPLGPPGAENGSAPDRTGCCSGIGILRREGLGPPVLGRGRRLRVLVDAVDRTHGHAFAAARAELGDDDHVDPVVENGAELVGAVADAGVAVDALRHLDAQGGQLPLRVALPELDSLLARRRGHRNEMVPAGIPQVACRLLPREMDETEETVADKYPFLSEEWIAE